MLSVFARFRYFQNNCSDFTFPTNIALLKKFRWLCYLSVITEDHYFRWIGAKELRFHERYVKTMVPDPELSGVRVAHREVEPNPEGVAEQVHIAFSSKMTEQPPVPEARKLGRH